MEQVNELQAMVSEKIIKSGFALVTSNLKRYILNDSTLELSIQEVYRHNGTLDNVSVRISVDKPYGKDCYIPIDSVKISLKDSKKKQESLLEKIISSYKQAMNQH